MQSPGWQLASLCGVASGMLTGLHCASPQENAATPQAVGSVGPSVGGTPVLAASAQAGTAAAAAEQRVLTGSAQQGACAAAAPAAGAGASRIAGAGYNRQQSLKRCATCQALQLPLPTSASWPLVPSKAPMQQLRPLPMLLQAGLQVAMFHGQPSGRRFATPPGTR